MSTETVEVVNYEPRKETGFIFCPRCEFEIPSNIVICWKCGNRLIKRARTGK
jgi:hypothetical protein